MVVYAHHHVHEHQHRHRDAYEKDEEEVLPCLAVLYVVYVRRCLFQYFVAAFFNSSFKDLKCYGVVSSYKDALRCQVDGCIGHSLYL
ncbi:hypothetical protein SDC9_164918 [bioreactor metagenome]|uniref:Uncharacterized protein n=1 Tax=bioreactor metagenome TaxID=1076179 RepID=A0A645G0C8_9ZZZZ